MYEDVCASHQLMSLSQGTDNVRVKVVVMDMTFGDHVVYYVELNL